MSETLSADMFRALHKAVFIHGGNAGMAASTRTLRALQRRGFVDGLTVTPAGAAALSEYHQNH